MSAINITSISDKLLFFRKAPEAAITAVIAVAVVLVAVLFYVVIFLINDYSRTKKEEHKAPDSHRLLVDIQKALLNEMKGTARQNALMIELTILFIVVTLIGIVTSILGPAKSMMLYKQIFTSVKSAILKFFGDFSRVFGR